MTTSSRMEHRLQNGSVLSFPLPDDFTNSPEKCLELAKMALRTYWNFVDGELKAAQRVPSGALPESIHAIVDDVEVCAWTKGDEVRLRSVTGRASD